MFSFHFFVFIVFSTTSITKCYKILGIFPLPSKSHAILGSELLRGFSIHGHNVTMLTYFEVDDAPDNFKTILMNIDKPRQVYETNMISQSWYKMPVLQIYQTFDEIIQVLYEDQQLKDFINSAKPDDYDAVIYFQCAQDSLLGFSHLFNASSIMFSAVGSSQMSSYTFGHPLPAAYVPNLWLKYSSKMSFYQRFNNWINYIVGDLYLHTYHAWVQCRLLRENFPTAPALEMLRDKVDLELINSHISVDTIRPTHQNMIHIGGYYMSNKEKISENVKQFLDKSDNGVILISFGTNIKSGNLDSAAINHFQRYFENSPFNILWKWDAPTTNVSANVKIVDWLPQRAVLSHPNVILFITHGGKGSTNEAVYYGVPMIIVPLYADQYANAEYYVQNSIALKIAFQDITSGALHKAVGKILTNTSYKLNIQLRSEMFRKQDVDPMKKAIYWTEAVIRSKDSGLFSSPSRHMTWYQTTCLDLITFTIFVLAIVIILSCLSFIYCYNVLVKCIPFVTPIKNLKTN